LFSGQLMDGHRICVQGRLGQIQTVRCHARLVFKLWEVLAAMQWVIGKEFPIVH